MTRDDIIAHLRLDNPTTTDETGQEHGPGSVYYESLLEVWADNMEASLPPAGRKVWPNAAAFLGEFAVEELAEISLSVNPTIAALRLVLAAWPGEVWSDDERILLGMTALVEEEILSEARAEEILCG